MNQEGVIKFQLKFFEEPLMPQIELKEINAWRKVMFQLRLIGKQRDRYGGFGYGNISRLIEPFHAPTHHKQFIITGTQTGDIEHLTQWHYCIVMETHPDENLVVAKGPIRPSSEALTHGVLYDIDENIRSVIHVHSPDIWKNAKRLGLYITRENIPYGTPEMSHEVKRLFRDTGVKDQLIFAMGGHEDGIVAFGRNLDETGSVLVRYLALAYQQ